MEDEDPKHGGQGHLPLKKRALNYSSFGAASSKKKRVDDSAGAESNDISDEENRLRKGKVQISDEENWLRKGKMQVKHETSPERHTQPQVKKKLMHDGIRSLGRSDEQPQVKKFMHDGIRSLGHGQSNERPPANKLMHDGIRSLARSNDARPHADAARLGEALRRRLAELGATAPWFVHKKSLKKSDVCVNQNRLLVSCKKSNGALSECPITRCFSAGERQRVMNKSVGLNVTALDQDGASYELTCKFLFSNSGYRFINEWKDFLRRNGVVLRNGEWTRDVEVELLAFRSRALPFQPRLDEEDLVDFEREYNEDGEETIVRDENKKEVYHRIDEHLHQDGSLGFILLHHEKRRRVESEEDDGGGGEGPSSWPVARKKSKKQKQSGKWDAPESSAAAASEAVARREELAVAVAELLGGEMPSEEMLNAAIGLEKLRQEALKRGGHEASNL